MVSCGGGACIFSDDLSGNRTVGTRHINHLDRLITEVVDGCRKQRELPLITNPAVPAGRHCLHSRGGQESERQRFRKPSSGNSWKSIRKNIYRCEAIPIGGRLMIADGTAGIVMVHLGVKALVIGGWPA